MKIDFGKILIKDVRGAYRTTDVSEVLGNTLYMGARDCGTAELGQRIYREKCVDLTAVEARKVREYVEGNFTYVYKMALLPQLNCVIEQG